MIGVWPFRASANGLVLEFFIDITASHGKILAILPPPGRVRSLSIPQGKNLPVVTKGN